MQPAYSQRFVLTPVSPGRSEREIRQEVNEILEELSDEAKKILSASGQSAKADIRVESEGGLFGVGEWVMVFAIFFGKPIIETFAKKVGEQLFDIFIQRVRGHNLLPKVLPGEIENPGPPQQGHHRIKSTKKRNRLSGKG